MYQAPFPLYWQPKTLLQNQTKCYLRPGYPWIPLDRIGRPFTGPNPLHQRCCPLKTPNWMNKLTVIHHFWLWPLLFDCPICQHPSHICDHSGILLFCMFTTWHCLCPRHLQVQIEVIIHQGLIPLFLRIRMKFFQLLNNLRHKLYTRLIWNLIS